MNNERSSLPFLFVFLFAIVKLSLAQALYKPDMIDISMKKLVSRADLHYDTQVVRSEEGLPIGNGTMGSLIWTTPKQIKMQINRVDVFAADNSTNSFPEVDTDYSHGCAFVDIEFGDYGPDIFPPDNTVQHLSVYDGIASVKGKEIDVEIFAWPKGDIIAINVNDKRESPTSIRINLRSLRNSVFKQRNHYAFTNVGSNENSIYLSQQFVEGDDVLDRWIELPEHKAEIIENRTYYCSSSVGATIIGSEAQINHLNDGEIQLAIKPQQGSFTILVSSASSFNIAEDINKLALIELESAKKNGPEEIEANTLDWWHEFWSNSFLHLSSDNGEAEYVEKHYTYFLYLMASSSRGEYPPRYGGMIWNTGGDTRLWGSMKWMYNLFCYYNNVLLASNKIDITSPVFNMIHKNYDATALAAEQQWGSKGIYLQETLWFNGPDSLPEDIAEEMRELYLARKSFSEASEKFLNYAAPKNAFDSRWSWKNFDIERWIDGHYHWEPRSTSPYTYVLHLFASGAKIAYYHWLRYDYTQDFNWLREYGYPVIKGVAEFYRNYPNVKKMDDGKYHIIGVNNWESTWGSSDTIEELAGMKAITLTAIKASEILGVDEDMRPIWKEFHENIVELPTMPDTTIAGNERIWVTTTTPALEDALPGRNVIMRRSTTPSTYFDYFTLETKDPEMIKLAQNTYAPSKMRNSGSSGVGWLSKAAKTAATMGDAKGVKVLVPGQLKYMGLEEGYEEIGARWGSNWRGPLANRMSLAEGRQAMGAQRIGNAIEGLMLALCRAMPEGPAGETVIHVFPAWPKEWDADFSLLTRGNFIVTSSMQNEIVNFIEIYSQSGGICKLRNPWGDGTDITIYEGDRKLMNLNTSLIEFYTDVNKNYIVVKANAKPIDFKRSINVFARIKLASAVVDVNH